MESITKQYLTGGEVISVQNLINKNYPNDYIHFSLSPDWEFHDQSQQIHYGFKPKGLWLGRGTSWLDYLQAIDWYDRITEYCSVFVIEIDESRIITLSSKKEYLDFTKLYGEQKAKPKGRYSVISNIDWFSVAQDYDGIRVVNPQAHKFDVNISWVYGWDISSVCIWNDDAIKSHDLIFEGQKEASTRFGEGGILDSGALAKGGIVIPFENIVQIKRLRRNRKNYGDIENQKKLPKMVYYLKGKTKYDDFNEDDIYSAEYVEKIKGKGVRVIRDIDFAKGGIVWKKNIGDDGWSSTMESESAYDNEGGYISESGNWKIYRDGRYYERDWGDNYERRGDWLVYGKNEYGRVEEFYGIFETLSKAKKYVERWVEINPKDFAKGGGIDGNLCTYSFEGYMISEVECEDKGIKYLMPKEYPAVAKWLYINHQPLWIYYNYLHRLSISYKECEVFIDEANTFFNPTFDMRFNGKNIKRSNAGWEKLPMKPMGRRGALYNWKEHKGWWWAITINISKNSSWTELFRNPRTNLPTPQYEGDAYSLTTVIHEYAHALDFDILISKKQAISQEWFPLTVHKDTFLNSLYKILKACRDGKIPIVAKLDAKGILIQKGLEGDMGSKILARREEQKMLSMKEDRRKEIEEGEYYSWRLGWNKSITEFMKKSIPTSHPLSKKLGTKEVLNFEDLIVMEYLIDHFQKNHFQKILANHPDKANALSLAIETSKRGIMRLVENHKGNMERGNEDLEVSEDVMTAYKKCDFGELRDSDGQLSSSKLEEWYECMKKHLT